MYRNLIQCITISICMYAMYMQSSCHVLPPLITTNPLHSVQISKHTIWDPPYTTHGHSLEPPLPKAQHRIHPLPPAPSLLYR